MRWHALNALVRAYRPAVPLAALAAAAGFLPQPPRAAAGDGDGDGDGAEAAWEALAAEEGRQQRAGAAAPAPGRHTLRFAGDAAAAPSEAAGLAAAEEYARACGAVLVAGGGGDAAGGADGGGGLLIDCKASAARGALRPPPEKEKVAHGDVNLDINDFLAKMF